MWRPPGGELGIATTFNFLGPLTNPARVRAQATGVADARMAPIMAGVLADRGSSALVFRGDDGLDELTTTATSQVWVVRDGKVDQVSFDPRDVGIDLVPVEALRGADAAHNADVARRLLAGETGPVRDAVLLNSAAALVALSPGDAPLEEAIAAGIARAAESLDSGAAQAALTAGSQPPTPDAPEGARGTARTAPTGRQSANGRACQGGWPRAGPRSPGPLDRAGGGYVHMVERPAGAPVPPATVHFKVTSDSAKAPARCPATLRPWRGAPGDDQAVSSKAHGKRGPLVCTARGPGCCGEFVMSVTTVASDRSLGTPLPVLGRDVLVPLVTGGEVGYAALDYAASAPALQRVWDDVAAYAPYYGSVHRGAGYLSQLSTDLFEQSRETVAEFLRCRADDQVVFTRSTTDSLNLLAAALPKGTEVFVFETEHHAALLPWEASGQCRVTYLSAPRSPAEAVTVLERALAAREGAGQALVCVTGASNVTGELWPVRELTAAAHAHGARVVLDAAQLAPHQPIDVRSWDVDWVAFSGHKLYAPFGAGVLAGRADWLRDAEPYLAGGGASRTVTRGADGRVDVEWHTSVARHEAGSPNVIGAYAIASACRALHAEGFEALADRERELVARVLSGLARIPQVKVLSLFGAGRRAGRGDLVRGVRLEQFALGRGAVRRVRHRRARRSLLRPPAGPHPAGRRLRAPGGVRRVGRGTRRAAAERGAGELRGGYAERARGAVPGRAHRAGALRREVELPHGGRALRAGPGVTGRPSQPSRPMEKAASRSCWE